MAPNSTYKFAMNAASGLNIVRVPNTLICKELNDKKSFEFIMSYTKSTPWSYPIILQKKKKHISHDPASQNS